MNNWKKTFSIIWAGQFFSSLTSSIVGFAVVFWLSIKTGSAEVLASAMIATLLPFIVLGIFTGVYVDRWDRKRTMILSDVFVAICSAILGILFYLDIAEMWQIYLLLALRSIGNAFQTPAMQASIPLLAPESELMRIAGIGQIIQSTSNIAGPALGAVIMSMLDMTYVMALDVFGALVACFSLLFVSIPNPEKKTDNIPNVWMEMKEGLRHMFADKGLTYLLGCVIITIFFLAPVAALFPLMTIQYFGGNAFQMGLVEICWGIGMFLGGAVLSIKYIKNINKIIIIDAMIIVIGITYWWSGGLPQSGFALFTILCTIAGASGSVYWSTITVILQTKIDPVAQGRVFSIYDSISLLPTIPGLLATGHIAQEIGLSNAFIIAGIAILCVGILLLFIPQIRQLSKELDTTNNNQSL